VNEAWRPSLTHKCPNDWFRLIEKCWAQNPAVRPDISVILQSLKELVNIAPQEPDDGYESGSSEFDNSVEDVEDTKHHLMGSDDYVTECDLSYHHLS